jgi:hypothetical protein
VLFELHGTEIAQCGVPSPRIVEALDIVEHVGLGLIPRSLDLAGYPLGLERGEQALHCCIIPYVPRAAHRADDAVIGKREVDPIWLVMSGSSI